MLKTRRYKTIWDGSRRFVGFDKRNIDRATTVRQAYEAVDRTEVEALVDEFKAIELDEDNYVKWAVTKERLARAMRRYVDQVNEYCRQNPIHFEPREGEEIICPLIEHAKTN